MIKPLGVASKLTGSRALSSGVGCACLSEAGCLQGRLPLTTVLREEQAFVSAPSTTSFLLKSGCCPRRTDLNKASHPPRPHLRFPLCRRGRSHLPLSQTSRNGRRRDSLPHSLYLRPRVGRTSKAVWPGPAGRGGGWRTAVPRCYVLPPSPALGAMVRAPPSSHHLICTSSSSPGAQASPSAALSPAQSQVPLQARSCLPLPSRSPLKLEIADLSDRARSNHSTKRPLDSTEIDLSLPGHSWVGS